MNVTALVAEILIVGIQGTIWIGLLVASFLNYEKMNWLNLNGWQPFVITLYLATAYYLGILIDRLSDSALHKFDIVLRRKYFSTSNQNCPSVSKARLAVMFENENVAKFLDYVRSRMRIARSTCVNTGLITISAIVLTISTQYIQQKVNTVLVILFTGLPMSFITIYVWYRITITYYERLMQAYEMLEAKKGRIKEAPQA
jgi:hypothetical protein